MKYVSIEKMGKYNHHNTAMQTVDNYLLCVESQLQSIRTDATQVSFGLII